MTAKPGTKSEELARQLLDHGVRTVVLTKDRNVADRSPIRYGGHVIPVYFKQRLVSDKAYVAQLVQNLGGPAVPVDEVDYTEKMYALQEKALRGTISAKEKSELRTLLARVRLEETQEAARIEQAQTGIKKNVESLIGLIRDVTSELDEELKVKHAVHSKNNGS